MALIKSLILALSAGTLAAAQCAVQPSSQVVAAEGVNYKLLRNNLARPRHLVVDSEDNVLILEAGSGSVRRLVMDGGEGTDVCIQSDSAIISNQQVRFLRCKEPGRREACRISVGGLVSPNL